MIEPAYRYAATVARIIDGDTLELIIDVGFRIYVRTPVRLAGIDCPERSSAEGQRATDFVADWVGAHPKLLVETTPSVDRWGRWLGVVLGVDTGQVLNDVLVEAGHARVWTEERPQ